MIHLDSFPVDYQEINYYKSSPIFIVRMLVGYMCMLWLEIGIKTVSALEVGGKFLR